MNIRQDKRTGIYKAFVKTPSGIKQFSTKQSNLRMAKKVAKEAGLEQLEQHAHSNTLTHKVVSQILSGDREVTLESSRDEWLEWFNHRGKSPRTIENARFIFNRWTSDMEIADLHPSMVTEAHISEWINDEAGKIKAASRRLYTAVIRSYFGWATAKGHVLKDPSALVSVDYRLLTHEQKESKRVQLFTDEEIRKLLDGITDLAAEAEGAAGSKDRVRPSREEFAARAERYKFWKSAIIISRYTGLRLGDIACLEWSALEKPDAIVVWTAKRDARVELPRRPKALADALSQIKKVDDRYCFPEQRGIATNAEKRSWLSHDFKRLCERFDIEGRSFHGLRHTYASDMAARGWPTPHIKDAMGHSSERTTKGYIKE